MDVFTSEVDPEIWFLLNQFAGNSLLLHLTPTVANNRYVIFVLLRQHLTAIFPADLNTSCSKYNR